MSRQTRASVNTCIVLGVSSAGSERIDFGRGGARRWRQRWQLLQRSAACLLSRGRWRDKCVRSCARTLQPCSAAVPLGPLTRLRAASDQINRCKLMLVTERAHNVARAFPSRALACGTAAIGVAAAAWARALFIEHNLEPLLEESCGALCCSLATFGQARHPLSQLAHFVVSLALCAAVRVERIASSSRSVNQLPH